MRIILKDGRTIQTSQEEIKRMVTDALVREGFIQKSKLKRFNKPKDESLEEYVVEELHVEQTGYTKGKKLKKEDVVALFKAIQKNAAANNFYVGITCDPDRREGEHKAEFLAVIACPDKNMANDLEKTLDSKGYDAGDAVGNVHKAQSRKVYIYKKTSQTIE